MERCAAGSQIAPGLQLLRRQDEDTMTGRATPGPPRGVEPSSGPGGLGGSRRRDLAGGELLGEPEAGVIHEAGPADFALFHGDPLSDPTALWRVWRVAWAE